MPSYTHGQTTHRTAVFLLQGCLGRFQHEPLCLWADGFREDLHDDRSNRCCSQHIAVRCLTNRPRVSRFLGGDGSNLGLTPRICEMLFYIIDNHSEDEVTVTANYLEIYNEKVEPPPPK